MTAFVALLRAVNVGGTGKLPMAALTAMCESAGFARVRTYIASGNVVFRSPGTEAAVKSALEARLLDYAGRPVGVLIRTAAEMADILAKNPFPAAPGNKVAVIFMNEYAAAANLGDVTGDRDGEEIRIGVRELYVYYPNGMGNSKLRIPAARAGTARNANTVAKLAEMANANKVQAE